MSWKSVGGINYKQKNQYVRATNFQIDSVVPTQSIGKKDTTAYVDDFSGMPTGDTTGGETDPGTAYVDDFSNMPSEGFVDQSRSFQHGAHNRMNQRGE